MKHIALLKLVTLRQLCETHILLKVAVYTGIQVLIIFLCVFMDLVISLAYINMQKEDLAKYPAILTLHYVSNPVYMLQVNLFLRSICSNLGQFVPT